MNSATVTLVALITSAVLAHAARAADFSFAPPQVSVLPEGHTPTAIRLGDLDGDGKLDAVVTGRNWDFHAGHFGRVSVLRGVGDGHFVSWHEILVLEGSTEDAAVVDLDGDGKRDVALTVSGPRGRMAVARGHGDGTFDPPIYLDLERQPRGITSGDFDGDGHIDLAAVNANSASLQIVRNEFPRGGNLALASTRRLAQYLGGLPFAQQVTAADLDGDGVRDLAVTMIGAGRVGVTLLGGAVPRSADWKPAPIADEAPAVIGASVADFDNDGVPDIALPVLVITQTQKVVMLRNDGHAGFAQQSVFDTGLGFYTWCSAPIDVDGDGRRDLAIGTALSGAIVFMRNETAGPGSPLSFTIQPFLIPYGLFVRDLVSADIDNDGDADLVGIEIAGSTVFTVLNQTPQGGVASDAVPRPVRRTMPKLQGPKPWVMIDVNDDGVVDALDVARSLEQMSLPPRGGAR